MQQSPVKTIAFLGASGGLGLAALRQTLAAGHRCVALCRDPSKFTAIFPELDLNVDGSVEGPSAAAPDRPLTLVRGNAHDIDSVARCLVVPDATTGGVRRLVDIVVFTIGGKMLMAKRTLDDPNVCANGMATLLAALERLRSEGVANSSGTNTPRIVAVSTTGISRCGRDVPLAFLPLYHGLLPVPHADKRVMEDKLVASGELFAMMRPSFLVDDEEATDKDLPGSSKEGEVQEGANAKTTGNVSQKEFKDRAKEELKERKEKVKEEFKSLKEKYKKEGVYQSIRVGIEDPIANKRISSAVGYTISRADAGRWLAENLVLPDELPEAYVRRIATITY